MGHILRSAVQRSPTDTNERVPKLMVHGTSLSSQHGIMIETQRKKGPFNIITLTEGTIYIVNNLAEVEYWGSELLKSLRLQDYYRLKFGLGLFFNVPHSKRRVIVWQRWKSN